MAAMRRAGGGGIRALEITLTLPTPWHASRAVQRFGTRAVTGAGSVTTRRLARGDPGWRAICGHTHHAAEIVTVAKGAGCVVALGAFTPTEAQSSYEAVRTL